MRRPKIVNGAGNGKTEEKAGRMEAKEESRYSRVPHKGVPVVIRGYTLKDLAGHVGVNPTHLSKLRLGIRVPSLPLFLSLQKFLGLSQQEAMELFAPSLLKDWLSVAETDSAASADSVAHEQLS